jgi:hypothetical protein
VGRPRFASDFRGLGLSVLAAVRGRWRHWVPLFVMGLGVLELCAHYRFANAAPDIEAWRAVRPVVQAAAAPEDLILVSPRWAEPQARLVLGDSLMPLSHVARADESLFARALEISILGERAAELEGWQLEREERFGGFDLRTWRNPRSQTSLYDFFARAEPPHLAVYVERDGKPPESCPFGKNHRVSNGDLGGHPTFPRRRFACSGAEWSFVGRTVIEDQSYRPRQCLWAHPIARAALTLRYDAVLIGSVIRGYGALPFLIERERRGSPIELSASVGGEVVGIFRHADGDGWKAFEISTERFRGQTLPVEFRIRSKREARRDFCFQADVR